MRQLVNADPHGRIAMQGYDPVAFHVDGGPVKGDPSISAEYRGYKYFFSSEDNKARFEENSDPYLPAYGGFCAFGITLEALVPVEMDTWEIIDGRVVLQYSQQVKQKFAEQNDQNTHKANANWAIMAAEGNG